MSASRFLKAALVLVALALVACDDPARVAAPEPWGAPGEASSGEQHGDAGLAVSTWPRSVIAEFETELEATLASRDPIVRIEWRFADGAIARGQKIRHTFSKEGVTSVLVRATTERGDQMQKQVNVNVTPSIAQLAQTLSGIVPGGVHTCAIDASSALWCWGFNGDGNLGNNSTVDSPSPLNVGGQMSFAQIATGFSHSCALTAAGEAYCWGRNYSGQLGDGTTTRSLVPTRVATELTFTSIDIGFSHSCAATDAGVAYCWGANDLGQLGTGASTGEPNLLPVPVSTSERFRTVRAGYNHTCGLTTGAGGTAAFCWGHNHRGQVGDGLGGVTESDHVAIPTRVGALLFNDLDVGGSHNCGLVGTQIWCWGWNGSGQLGRAASSYTCGGVTGCELAPRQVPGTAIAVTAGSAHTCGLTSTGIAYCAGANTSGQLGAGNNSSSTGSNGPVRVATTLAFKTIRAGGSFTCGVALTNEAYCWGSNNTGKLGDGTTTNQYAPVRVPDLVFP